MRKLLVFIALTAGACTGFADSNTYDFEPIVGQGHLEGLVNGSQVDDQADIVHAVEPGMWSDLILTNPDNGGAFGMLMIYVEGDINDLLTPGVHEVSYTDGVSAQLCGEDEDEEWYDEEADEITIEVERDEDGSGTVVFTASTGDQFQIGTVLMGTDGFPVSKMGPGGDEGWMQP